MTPLSLVNYTAKSFIVIGNTQPHKETLKALGGKYNAKLKAGAGWIFPTNKKQEVLDQYGDLICEKATEVSSASKCI